LCFHIFSIYIVIAVDTGRGIFFTEFREKNTFIVEYFGELITADEAEHREEKDCVPSVFRYFLNHRSAKFWLVLFG